MVELHCVSGNAEENEEGRSEGKILEQQEEKEMKLRKCKCGGNPVMFGIVEGELRHVYCDKCGTETLSYWDGRRAQSNWNYLMREEK